MNTSQKSIPLLLAFKTIRFFTMIVFSFFLKKISGTENLLKDRPFVVASNHASLMDGLLITAYLSGPMDHNLHLMRKAKYYING